MYIINYNMKTHLIDNNKTITTQVHRTAFLRCMISMNYPNEMGEYLKHVSLYLTTANDETILDNFVIF